MNDMRRLPDAELEVMKAVWDCEPPVSLTKRYGQSNQSILPIKR